MGQSAKFKLGDTVVGNERSNQNYGVFCKRFNVKALITHVDPRRGYRLKVTETTQTEDLGYEMYLPIDSVEENMELARELTPDELFEAYISGSLNESEYTKRRGRG